jgi:hypothetical protein
VAYKAVCRGYFVAPPQGDGVLDRESLEGTLGRVGDTWVEGDASSSDEKRIVTLGDARRFPSTRL